MKAAKKIGTKRKTRKRQPSGYAFYTLMRNDLASMNPGKACAQSTHAAHAQMAMLLRLPPAQRKVWQKAFLAWSQESRQGFGTAITKEAPIEDIRVAVKEAKRAGLLTDIILDDTYPLRDGQVTHLIPVQTCAFVFGRREVVKACPTLGPMVLMG
jgi:peptidyl-tRNA hydrolase